MRPDLHVGERYAYREHPFFPLQPLLPVEIVKFGPKRSQKVQVRWLAGEYEGMEQWTTCVRLVARLEDAESLLEDEHRTAQANQLSADMAGTPVHRAVELVFLASPIHGISFGYRGNDEQLLVVEDPSALSDFLGLSEEAFLNAPGAWTDREGTLRAPFQVAERVARVLCEKYPREILAYIATEESDDRQAITTGYYTSSRYPERDGYFVDVDKVRQGLREEAPAYALVRQWCGDTAVSEYDELIAAREELDRLRRLVEVAASWIEANGNPQKARALLRSLRAGC